MLLIFLTSGTKDFVIEIANSAYGLWTKVTEGTLPDPRGDANKPVEKIAYRVSGSYKGQFIRFRCMSWWGYYCALQYITWN